MLNALSDKTFYLTQPFDDFLLPTTPYSLLDTILLFYYFPGSVINYSILPVFLQLSCHEQLSTTSLHIEFTVECYLFFFCFERFSLIRVQYEEP